MAAENHHLIPIGQVPQKLSSVPGGTAVAYYSLAFRDHRGPRYMVDRTYAEAVTNRAKLAMAGALANKAGAML